MPGLLIDGVLVQVDGVRTISPTELGWAHLSREDFVMRMVRPQMAVLHKTIADDPEKLLVGSGPTSGAGGAEYTAEAWQDDPKPSAAHNITGHDGVTVCLADLVKACAWHGNQANLLSYGHEIKELKGGGFYAAAGLAAVLTTLKATRTVGIQWQCPHAYTGPLKRMKNGGSDLVGIFGHRDITAARNRWDPGDWLFDELGRRGVERFDFAAGQDRDVWSERQRWLQKLGYYTGWVDGIPGAKTSASLKAIGYPDGIFAAWRLAAEKPPLPPGYAG